MKSDKVIYMPGSDRQFQKPFIDCEETRQRVAPDGSFIECLYIHGGFEGTNVKFSFHFPPRDQYEGRFFQYLSPFPGPDEELASQNRTGEEDQITFALVHGACFVESNMGSGAIFGSEADSTIFYRSSAAVAEFCRTTAKRLFGEHRVYGYVYGGSGGGYKTMSCIENTSAFDGAVPYVIGSPVSLPSCLTVMAHGSRLLRHVWPKIVDALEPGGSGDMYEGLNAQEQAALKEITRMGFPPRMCFMFGTGDDGSLPVLAPVVHAMDPDYFTDFWTKPGYLGAVEGGSARRDRIYLKTKVVRAGILGEKAAVADIDGRNKTDDAWQKMLSDQSSAFIELEQVPEGEDLFLKGVDIIFKSGKAAGKKLSLGRIDGHKVIPGMSYGTDSIESVFSEVKPGDEVLLDNSDYIAIQTYHRHQIPQDTSFHAWDQFRDASGQPIYPQRPKVICFDFTRGGCGSVQDGQIQGKVIVVNNLMDGDFPWQADWYRKKVAEVNGPEAENMFRLWYNDNCPHGDQSEMGDHLRTVSYLGVLYQALLDLSRWVEKGIEPAPTSGYTLEDGQIVLAETAMKRQGVQPLVRLLVHGSAPAKGIAGADGTVCARVSAGLPVHFTAEIDLPAGAGNFVSAEWSFEGEQDFPVSGGRVSFPDADNPGHVLVETEHVFERPGTYFAVVKVTSNRQPEDGFTQLRNLARARVIVEY